MKKLLLTSLMVAAGFVSSYAGQVTVTLGPNTWTNVLGAVSPTNGSFVVKQVIITAVNSNATISLVDSPNGTRTNFVNAYTNILSYATNVITANTDYYGNVTLLTNIGLIDVTNNLVAAITNRWPTVFSAGAALNQPSTIANGNYVFQNGIWCTNDSTLQGTAIVTVIYQNGQGF